MEGEWLKTSSFMEDPDPVTGVTKEFCILGDSDDQICFLDPYAGANIIQTKHATPSVSPSIVPRLTPSVSPSSVVSLRPSMVVFQV